MSEDSRISWTHNSFNPWLGCLKVSDGCKHCYAETLVTGIMHRNVWGPASTHRRDRTSVSNWQRVRRWNKAAEESGIATRVFCASLADVFEDHPDCNAARPDLWDLIRTTPFLQWQILTKRPENIRAMLPPDWHQWPDGYPNVWLGTSIEDMRVAERADYLRRIPAVVRFISYEPALGPCDDLDLTGIDWVIFGGESGPGYRPMKVEWARTMRERCAEPRGEHGHTTAFFYKQSAAPRTETRIKLDGEIVRAYPMPRSTSWGADRLNVRVREAYLNRWAEDHAMVGQP